MSDHSAVRVSLMGACTGTSNLGVNALFASAVAGIGSRIPDVSWTAFDSKNGRRVESHRVDMGEPVEIRAYGIRIGRKIYRQENIYLLDILRRVGGGASNLSPWIRALRSSKVVIDVSGGDSFTDMYPDNRIDLIAGAKELVLNLGVPLILLPQTYGPFDESMNRASKIVRGASGCFARDERSFETLKEMLGPEFDPDRHRCGVDMAFGLAVREPEVDLPARIMEWLQDRSTPVIGLNVSGLIGNVDGTDKDKYGFVADYRETILSFLEGVFEKTESRVILIPHVIVGKGPESDPSFCDWVAGNVRQEHRARIATLPPVLDQCESKWLISRCDWFCGTRMHATIASLSTGVPTATISYSDKAQGVFESCGLGDEVFDPRRLGTEEIVERLHDAFARRRDVRSNLAGRLGDVQERARIQMDEIVAMIQELQSP